MNLLVLLIGCSVGLNIYLGYKIYAINSKVKSCIHCAEKIKEQAKICRWCNRSQINHIGEFSQTIVKHTTENAEKIFNEKTKEVSTQVAFTVARQFFKTNVFMFTGIKILEQTLKKK